jgi:hypothetical protein
MIDQHRIAMKTCVNCGLQYHPQARAWENMCGVCIATRIELALMPGGLGHAARKPLKRANDPFDSAGPLRNVDVQALRRHADG